ncbi:MAG TPA: VOC family protein [Lachnospiraceae bacterium]|nr:VOC family protein [Lachnospiraceae bacterium]
MMASITHIALYSKDIEKSREYYITYFGGKSNELYRNDKGFSSYFLTFGSGARLEIMSHVELNEYKVADKTNGWNHIAFSVGDKETVLELTNRIVSDGYELLSPPRVTGDGYFESCVADPDGNRVEITV